MKKILVIGAGSWGTALANTLAYNNKNVFLWTEKQKISDQINKTKINKKYFRKILHLYLEKLILNYIALFFMYCQPRPLINF